VTAVPPSVVLLRATTFGLALLLASAGVDAGEATVHEDRAAATPAPESVAATSAASPALDRTGRRRVGKASFYAKRFAGKKMADGTLMQPHGDNAASKTLPLGTTAKVTNLETGKSAVVTIQDRGPYVKGRIVDLSPGTAKKLGIEHADGVAKVEVSPISVPLADGTTKPGAASGENANPKP
jgi:rare lipoprotein A